MSVPAIIFKRRKKKVETIQDYASTAIELLTGGNRLQLPPHLPPRPSPHLPRMFPRQSPRQSPRQFPQQYSPLLPTDSTSVSSENSSVNDGYYPPEHVDGTSSETADSEIPQFCDELGRYERLGNAYDRIGTYDHDNIHKTNSNSAAYPTPTSDVPPWEDISSNDKNSEGVSRVNKGGQNMATNSANVSHSRESVVDYEAAKGTDLVRKKRPQHVHPGEGHYERLGHVYERIGTYETVGNVYDQIGTYETIEHTSSAAHPTPRSDAPTQEETVSKDETPERVNSFDGRGRNMATAVSVSHSQVSSKQPPPVHTSGTVDSEGAKGIDSVQKKAPRHRGEGHRKQLGAYETVGNVYDKICTYETIGNVYDNSLVPKL